MTAPKGILEALRATTGGEVSVHASLPELRPPTLLMVGAGRRRCRNVHRSSRVPRFTLPPIFGRRAVGVSMADAPYKVCEACGREIDAGEPTQAVEKAEDMPEYGQQEDLVWTLAGVIHGTCRPPRGYRLRGD